MQKLFFRELGEDHSQTLIILHGLFGSSDNWLTLGRQFAEHFHVYIVDQRNHGQSFHADEFSYTAMANDLHQFYKRNNIESAHIIGHSMGGKTAMQFAINFPECVDKLIVADIAPKSYPVHHHAILKGLFELNLNELESRKHADEILSDYVPELGVRQFLLKNLIRGENGFEWRINLPIIAKNIEQVGLGLNENSRFANKSLFIRGGKSDYVLDNDANQIHSIFKQASIETIHGAGHWLHAEQPKQFLTLTLNFLRN